MNEKQFRSLNAKNFTTILQESLIPDKCHTRNGWKMVASWINKFDFKNRILWNQLTNSELYKIFSIKNRFSYRLDSLSERFATLTAEHFQQIFHILANKAEYFKYVPPKYINIAYINIAVSSFDTVASSKLRFLLSTHINEKLHFLTKENFKTLIKRHLLERKRNPFSNPLMFINHRNLFQSIPIDKMRDLPWEDLDMDTICNIIFPETPSDFFTSVYPTYFSTEITDRFALLTGEDVYKIFSKLSNEHIMKLITREQLSYGPLHDLYELFWSENQQRRQYENSSGFSSGTRNDRRSSSRSSNSPIPSPSSSNIIPLPKDADDFINAVKRSQYRTRNLNQTYKQLTRVYHPDKITQKLKNHLATLYAPEIESGAINLQQKVQIYLSDPTKLPLIYAQINAAWDKFRK